MNQTFDTIFFKSSTLNSVKIIFFQLFDFEFSNKHISPNKQKMPNL